MQWDLFCRVIDNHGDIGVCWRLAADLAARGEHVRLWVDDASALQWMAPQGAAGVSVLAWPPDDNAIEPGDVVIEAFACALPTGVVKRMAARPHAPIWINLEYLSAEGFVERSHRLMSPQTDGPGAGLRKWFFYPGFTSQTGGLLREADTMARQRSFDARAWLSEHAAEPASRERVVSLFCYEQPALPGLIDQLAQQPTLLLATAGHAARQIATLLGPGLRRGALRALLLPTLTQRDYDHLLWASDVNFVRGEDSFVRAQWAGKPFVWQIYPQTHGAHLPKLDAFLARFGAAPDVRAYWLAWNMPGRQLPSWPTRPAWRGRCEAWRDSLLAQADLVTQLLGFVAETR